MTESTIRVPHWFQGPTDSGQGGWTSGRLAAVVGQPITVRLRAPIPLEVDLVVEGSPEQGWRCLAGEVVVLDASPWSPDVPETASVSVRAARSARDRFPVADEDHPVPFCFSCGLQADGMHVHAGPLGDDPERYATDWTAPGWAARPDGSVDDAVLWAALDCTAAWYVCCHPEYRHAVTAQFAAHVLRPIMAAEHLALVAWAGDWPQGWDGRKRGAVSAAFDDEGRLVASARSFWVARADA